MSTSSPLIINVIVILSLLFVCSSAQFWGFHQPPRNNRNDEEVADIPRGVLPRIGRLLPRFGRLPGFGGGGGGGEDEDEKRIEDEMYETPEQQRDEEDGEAKGKIVTQQDIQEKQNFQEKKPKEKKAKVKKPKVKKPKVKKPKVKKPKVKKPKVKKPKQKKPKIKKPKQKIGKDKEKPLPIKQGKPEEKPKEQNKPIIPVQGGQPGEVEETSYPGKWEIVSPNSGVSAMHLQLMPNNKLVMFDATSLGKSSIELGPGRCRLVPNTTNVFDCFAHAVEYDLQTNTVRTLKVDTDPWCSSGGLTPEGVLINTGGWKEGERSIRYFESCPTCDLREGPIMLADNRWYGTQTMLADGRYIVLGGRRAFNYEFLAPEGKPSPGRIDLPFLLETTDIHENNLYPFVHLAPDGNLFILANFRSILLDVRTNKIVRKYPDLPGGARNYPGSATSAILPIDLRNGGKMDIEVIVCGGGQPLAFGKAEKQKIFLPALDTCGRIKVLDPAANWEIEKMPTARIMSDMLNLPNGELILLNGAQKGASGWQFAEDPVLTPFLYSPNKPNGNRFKVLAPSQIPRMYHSSSAVLQEGKILVAGSNTNPGYLFRNVKFPTELRVEKYSPPYLDPALDKFMPKMVNLGNKATGYGKTIQVTFNIAAPGQIQQKDVMVTMYKPPFTTHGYSMNQRLLILKISSLVAQQPGNYQLQVEAPAAGELATPGHYLLFVNYRGVPGAGAWIQLK